MEPEREPVLVVVNNGYERRYFFSAKTAAKGLGWFVWPRRYQSIGCPALLWAGQRNTGEGEVQVYRLDVEATDTLMTELCAVHRKHNPKTGKWLPETAKRFQTIIQNCTGIKES